jgi:hypothetical protein
VRNLLESSTPVVETTLDNTVFEYTISLGVGIPVTYCEPRQFLPGVVFYMSTLDDLIVDTGSANTWVGANKSYNPTATSEVYPDTFVSIVFMCGFLAQLILKRVSQNITYGSAAVYG